jgi:outer membrane biosynthesis protein TonB
MKAGVTTSVIAHAAVLVIALVGLGSAKPMEPEVVESIAVDLVPISALTNIRQGTLDSKVVETETPAIVETQKPADLAKPTGNTQDDQVTPLPTAQSTPAPVMNTAPKPQPDPAPQPDPTPPKPVETPPPTPVAAPEPAPKPEEAQPQKEVATDTAATPAEAVAPVPASKPAVLQKAPVKAPPTETKTVAATPPKPVTPTKPQTATKQPDDKAAKIADQVADLINSEKSRGAVTGEGGSPTLGKTTGRAATLSQSALDGLVAQIKTCMSVPAGAAEAGVTTQLHFQIDAQGNVTNMPDVLTDTSDPLARALASAAQRAVMRCGPYPMAVNQEIQATFDPRELT